jgi:hypothetical protein
MTEANEQGQSRRFVALCNHGSQQARQALAGSALPRLARTIGESVKRNRVGRWRP